MLSQGAELAQGGGADLQQAAHFAGSVHRGRVDPGLVEEFPELVFSQVQNLGVTLDPWNAPQTAGERLYATHGITPLPVLPEGAKAPKNALVPESRGEGASRCFDCAQHRPRPCICHPLPPAHPTSATHQHRRMHPAESNPSTSTAPSALGHMVIAANVIAVVL